MRSPPLDPHCGNIENYRGDSDVMRSFSASAKKDAIVLEKNLKKEYCKCMIIATRRLIYPEGDIQEIQYDLRVNQLVDLNGIPLPLPLDTSRMIVYRVFRISTQNTRSEVFTNYFLEMMNRNEIEGFVRKPGSPRF
jgi:hypothetical protein